MAQRNSRLRVVDLAYCAELASGHGCICVVKLGKQTVMAGIHCFIQLEKLYYWDQSIHVCPQIPRLGDIIPAIKPVRGRAGSQSRR